MLNDYGLSGGQNEDLELCRQRPTAKRAPEISIVVPFHNEEENVTEFYARLKRVMDQTTESYEIVLVDDGSSDRTYALLKEVAEVDSRVVVVKLRRNFGQTSALAAGFDIASGEYIISMDGDLQHDPNDIPQFVRKLDEGYDIVSGWRRIRVDNFFWRRIPSRCANWMMARLSGVDIHDFGTTFKAYRRRVIHDIPLYGQMHRFIPALASWYGASICEIPIHNINRQHGRSHYGIGRTLPVFFDLITIRFLVKYLNRPLHLFGQIGILFTLAGGVGMFDLAASKILHPDVSLMLQHGPLFVISAVLMVAGIEFLAIGLLGELQVRHHHTSRKPVPYAIDRIVASHKTKTQEDDLWDEEESEF
jgi:glycosyltransferase involved in cell wall biosynthesis